MCMSSYRKNGLFMREVIMLIGRFVSGMVVCVMRLVILMSSVFLRVEVIMRGR